MVTNDHVAVDRLRLLCDHLSAVSGTPRAGCQAPSNPSWRRTDVASSARRRWTLLLLTVLLLGLGTVPAAADHRYDTYGDRGYVWFAAYDDFAVAWTTSNNCNPRELEAYDRVQDTTIGEFPQRWLSGILMSRHRCDGRVTRNIDIQLSYEPASNFITDGGRMYGGYNYSFRAVRSWCRLWNKSWPCGSHPSVVHLNSSRFGNSPYSHHYRRRLIMHETGHAFGLAHHCSSDSIMNNGMSDCNGGAWTNINGYKKLIE